MELIGLDYEQWSDMRDEILYRLACRDSVYSAYHLASMSAKSIAEMQDVRYKLHETLQFRDWVTRQLLNASYRGTLQVVPWSATSEEIDGNDHDTLSFDLGYYNGLHYQIEITAIEVGVSDVTLDGITMEMRYEVLVTWDPEDGSPTGDGRLDRDGADFE